MIISKATDGEIFPLQNKIDELYDIRKKKGGNAKKYDIMITAYFNDIYAIQKQLFQILNNNSRNLWVVGDSGLYGVHIPTDIFIGKIAELVGFEFNGLEILRSRQSSRHKLKLQESIVKMKR